MIDVRIMAHPSRRENVERILAALSLPDSVVTWDDRETVGDAMYTARRTWMQPIPEGCTHRLVLQDDVETCDRFLELAEQVAAKHPAQVVSFFHCEPYPQSARYVRTRRVWGCAVMIPAALVPQCWEYIEHIPERSWCHHPELIMPHDTDCITAWASGKGVPIINTVPALVQHIGDVSLVGITEKRIAPDYTKTPPTTGW